jgi:hypothetical protein
MAATLSGYIQWRGNVPYRQSEIMVQKWTVPRFATYQKEIPKSVPK